MRVHHGCGQHIRPPMPLASYLRFVLSNRRFVAFGFLAAFASSFGQTYFLGSFSTVIESELSLSDTAWGSVYMVGTLASALVLPTSGRRIDTTPLHRYTAAALGILCLGTVVMALGKGVVMLALAIFLLRQGGQGLMSHISMTSMTRYFDEGRGRAIALATLGFAAGEAILPRLSLEVVQEFGWRKTFGAVGAITAFVLLPALLWLLRGHSRRHAEYEEREAASSASASSSEVRSWTRSEVLRDPRFYLLLPGILAPPLIITAIFFTPLLLAAAKGWSGEWIVGSYGIFALASTLVGLACGGLIDRLGGTRLVPLMLVPMALGLVVAGTMRQPWSVWPYFALLGGSIGISHTAVSAMWAELYGVGSLGAIKSMVSSLAVLSSAVAPVIIGGLMDVGVPIETVCLYFACYAAIATVLLFLGLRRRPVLSAGQ